MRLSQDRSGQCQKQSVFCPLKIFSGRMWPCWLGQCRGTWENSFTTLNTKNISTTEMLSFTLNNVPATLTCKDVEVFLQIWNTHNAQMVITWKLKNLCMPVYVVCFHIYQTDCILRWWKPWRLRQTSYPTEIWELSLPFYLCSSEAAQTRALWDGLSSPCKAAGP